MVRPLTKRTSTGELYRRPTDVERHIDEALAQDKATIHLRSGVANQQSSDYLKSECLVHMLREARHKNDDTQINILLPVLLSRCEKITKSKIRDKELPNTMYLIEEILGRFSELFVADGTTSTCNELDYFECRFNHAFRAFRINIVKGETKLLQNATPLPTQDQMTESRSGEENAAYIRELLQTPSTQEEEIFISERRKALRKAILELTWEERKAIILCEILEYDIESENPDKKTVATMCNVTGRTVRNRLRKAKSRLLESPSLQKVREESCQSHQPQARYL